MPAEANILAAAKLRAKVPVGSVLNTAEWAQVPDALRDRAFFSAELEKVRLLQRMQDRIQTALDLVRREGTGADGGPGAFQTREKFIAEMQQLAREEGLDPRGSRGQPDAYGTIKDITSERRLKLIYDVQIESSQEYARWKAEQDPDVLAAYPAQQFVRVSPRNVPREDWPERWSQAGGEFYEGNRMIALKGDRVWIALSRFGVPWPPFDFGSGMGLVDIGREEAERLGLLQRGDAVKPMEIDFNKGMQASVADLSPEYRRQLQSTFGDQIEIKGDAVQWKDRPWGDKLFGGRSARKPASASVQTA
jgi:hypothetical protein